jgi:hypothetical protein
VQPQIEIAGLRLDGFSGLRPADLGPALEGALARLIAERGLPAGLREGRALGDLDGGALPAGAGMDSVARHLAELIYARLR